MANPWLKKNPFMSMWLSMANRVAGPLRGQATAQARRQIKAVMADAIATPVLPPTPSRRKR